MGRVPGGDDSQNIVVLCKILLLGLHSSCRSNGMLEPGEQLQSSRQSPEI